MEKLTIQCDVSEADTVVFSREDNGDIEVASTVEGELNLIYISHSFIPMLIEWLTKAYNSQENGNAV